MSGDDEHAVALAADSVARLNDLAQRRGWSVDHLVRRYLTVAADVDESGSAGLVNEDEHALIVTGLIALGLPEAWELIEKLDKRTLLWVRQSESP